MILIALLLISIAFFLALVALYISFMIGIELNEENEALRKELKYEIELKIMYESAYNELKEK